jgi:hypothetical protein
MDGSTLFDGFRERIAAVEQEGVSRRGGSLWDQPQHAPVDRSVPFGVHRGECPAEQQKEFNLS